jgi:hypothetical protein
MILVAWIKDYGPIVHDQSWLARCMRGLWRVRMGWIVGHGWLWVIESARLGTNITDYSRWTWRK